jgi:uroporphyrinogen-III decarboxylase
MEKIWGNMTPAEKREARFKKWLSPPDVRFPTPKAEKAYKERVSRFITAIKLKEPDRVPVVLPTGFFPVHYAGTTLQKVMYDYKELRRAWMKFLHDFEMDTYSGPGGIFPGTVFETLGYKLFKWPGHGLSPDAQSYQFFEGERMKAEDYDVFIKDPSDFIMRKFMPGIFSALEPFRELSPLTVMWGMPMNYFMPFGRSDVQTTFRTLADMGKDIAAWLEVVADCEKERLALGLPHFMGGGSEAPFDILGDKLRGTKEILLDMYRRPDKLLEAMDRIIPITLEAGISAANSSGLPLSGFALHKGNDTFMSQKQFETFYWPSLKKVLLGLINEGIVPLLFAEGSYMNRLEIIKDLPKGATVWWFEQMDMARAKKVLGDTACIAGNISASILCTGTPRDVKEHCHQIIEVAGRDGGFILTGGAGIDKGNPDNLRAIMEAAKEYGAYR